MRLGTFDETKPLPECFLKLVKFFESCQVGVKLNKVAVESNNDHSKDDEDKKPPLDEKMDQDDYKTDQWKEDMIEVNAETKSLETQWAEFHRCKNKITFALQLVAVLTVQGRMKTKSWFT